MNLFTLILLTFFSVNFGLALAYEKEEKRTQKLVISAVVITICFISIYNKM